MTVAYSLDIATSSLYTQAKVLIRWKGSVWKSIWLELLIWLIMYAVLSVIYRVLLNKQQRETFEDLCMFFDTFSVFIPVTFMLGFYVSIVYNRWTKVFDNVGWIDTSALTIAQYIRGDSERARLIRRNCVRYMIVAQALVFRDVSPAIRRRFPTIRHLVGAGLMNEEEFREFEAIVSPQSKYWQPIQWLFELVTTAKNEVYAQVVNLAVRTYFILALFGRQYLNVQRDIPSKHKIDLYFPIMTSLQIIFIIGWLKVSEVMLNPLGEDDEDFETHWIIERNLQVGYAVVDQAYGRMPPIKRDPFWEDEQPATMDSPAQAIRDTSHMRGSCIAMDQDYNGLFSTLRRRSRGDSESSAVTDTTGTKSRYLPHGESKGFIRDQSRRISNAIAKMYPEKRDRERRQSVCVAALDLNHRTSQTDLSHADNDEALPRDVEAMVRERIRSVESKYSDSVQIEMTDECAPRESEAAKENDEKDSASRENVKWFVEEMPVIHEEETYHFQRRHTNSN
ncbi:unnamed protein product [Caenorhabditis bovis]|uniref:Bestrophin homolog n=1 Tax=Caenorhabditis bovis TaxID=2654633 RepID=A0A8S1F3G3_9PELO|nr:unnamed protein product [Caenorhabditis bovis]